MLTPEKIEELQECSLEFYNFYVVSRVHENVIFDEEILEKVRNICRNFFKDQPYVYISKRVHSYNVNPLIYLKLKENEKLSGVAIVSDNFSQLTTANFEKQFSPLPFDIFDNLEEAIAWAQSVVENKKAGL
ncbi:MAG: STAS/SEC14 domain-containing protein [Salegentibacter sp.]